MSKTIADLPDMIKKLKPPKTRKLVKNLFEVRPLTGKLVVPEALVPKVAKWYGEANDSGPRDAVDRASEQRVVCTFNKFSYEGTLFNELRAKRPMERGKTDELESYIEEAKKGCDFCDPLCMTSADVLGRITGLHSVSAANAAKYDANHGMVVFGNHHPHRFGREHVRDYLDVARRWVQRAYENDSSLRFPFIMWNCLGSAGASLPHGHMHMLISSGGPYARQQWLMKVAEDYRESCPKTGGDYWKDWVAAHKALSLVHEIREEVSLVSSITPIKEKEVVVVGSKALKLGDTSFADAITAVLRCFIDALGVLSFNVGIYLPPMGAESGYRLPIVARCVDRGDPSPVREGKAKIGDIGGMELYGSPVVASDPFRVAEALGPYASLGVKVKGEGEGEMRQ